jgi:hypothetical protein
MINGFEEETAPLNYEEKLLCARFMKGLSKRVGKENAITAVKISSTLEAEGIKCEGARIRKIINHIRLNNLVPRLLATNRGYYVSTDAKEIEDYIEGLDQRIKAIQAVKDSIAYQLSNLTTK